ncbi:MAG TPA: hypothetical protein VFB69_05275 [Candidatus Dormibacteraeota bacterium]|nr:hypothetical protein [Candidatus Dormibacteraeota bacterium]
MAATCTGQPTGHEALVVMKGSPTLILADVTDANHPRQICKLTGAWSPKLVTQRMISWWASENPGQSGQSMLVSLDMFSGATSVIAKWQGGYFLDGIHAWSADESAIAYVSSDGSAVKLHLISGGGDRVVTQFPAVPGRGVNANEDDAYLGFAADGSYFALVQTFTSSGQQFQVRRTKDGTLAYGQDKGTMATWTSTGERLYFREPGGTAIKVWDPSAGVSTLIALPQAWLRPVSDAGDDNVAYTVLDSAGLPHVWLYGHDGRSGGQLPNVRSTPAFLNSSSLFLVEEVACGSDCGLGQQSKSTGNTYVFSLATQTETGSSIASVLGSWPRIGQT